MAGSCEFVKVGSTWLPNVAGVTLNPVYITDSERTLSGRLRTEHTGMAREWSVTLTGVPGSQVTSLLSALSTPAPHTVTVMGATTTAEVMLNAVTYRPKLSGSMTTDERGRADIGLTIREVPAT